MKSEIKNQIKRIDAQIETERRIHESWKSYRDCTIKTVVIHQSIGVIRGLEIAKEALEYILNRQDDDNGRLGSDEWLIRDQEIKRGLLINPNKPITGDPLKGRFENE